MEIENILCLKGKKYKLVEVDEEKDDWPKLNDDYYCLMSNGYIKYQNSGSEIYKAREKRGIFKTLEEAEHADGVRMLNAYLCSMNKGYEFVSDFGNYSVIYSTINNKITWEVNPKIRNLNSVYYKRMIDAQKAIDEMPDELKKYMYPREK